MVLVDATQEDQHTLLPPAWKCLSANLVEHCGAQARWAPLEVSLGIKRLLLTFQTVVIPNLLFEAKDFRARASEVENIQISAEQARKAGADFQRIWVRELQPRLALLSARSKRIVLPDIGHDIPADRPDVIIDAIQDVSRITRLP